MEREHTIKQYDIELREIREQLLEMGGKVEMMISDAMKSLVERDTALAEATIAYDHQINRMEVEIDDKCLQVLALRQPAAGDLRFITLALKIVTDLERIGDQCRNIAKHTIHLNKEPVLKPYIDLPRMALAAATMVREALDAFVHADADLALKVCGDDSFVDQLNSQIQRELINYMMTDPNTISRAIRVNAVAKCLERVADHATNVAEMVIFMIKGKDIRHMA